MHSPYLLRDLVKVEELEMLYAEFCLGTRATEEPSVTCRQKWLSRLPHQRDTGGTAPAWGETSPRGMQ